MCHSKYFLESYGDVGPNISKSIGNIKNERLEESLERHDISDYFVHISEPRKVMALHGSGYNIPSRSSIVADESYDFEFHQENNNIEETEYDFELDNYNKTNSMQEETSNATKKQESFNAISTTVPEEYDKMNMASLNTKPTFPSSPWNQSITLEDKVQRFLAQAAELAHQNTTKITSEYR